MPVLITCCPLLVEQETCVRATAEGAGVVVRSRRRLRTLSPRPRLLISHASPAPIPPLVVVCDEPDNVKKPDRPARVEPSWAPPCLTSPRILLFSSPLEQDFARPPRWR